jgi:hypothetical protein
VNVASAVPATRETDGIGHLPVTVSTSSLRLAVSSVRHDDRHRRKKRPDSARLGSNQVKTPDEQQRLSSPSENFVLDDSHIMGVPAASKRQPVLDGVDVRPINRWISCQHTDAVTRTIGISDRSQYLGVDWAVPGVDGRLRRVAPNVFQPVERNLRTADVGWSKQRGLETVLASCPEPGVGLLTYHDGWVYWSSGSAIWRVAKAGGPAEELAKSEAGRFITGLVVDDSGAYWIEESDHARSTLRALTATKGIRRR